VGQSGYELPIKKAVPLGTAFLVQLSFNLGAARLNLTADPVAGLIAVAALMVYPAIGFPVETRTLPDEVAIDPDVLVAAIGPIAGGVDEPRTRGWGDDDPRLRWGDFNVDHSGTSERNHRQGTQ
jgi:hypothetical protein